MGNADSTLKNLVKLGLVQELRVPSLERLELDGDLFAIGNVNAQIDVAEGSRSDLADETVLPAHNELGARG